jgi:hypothetical protein
MPVPFVVATASSSELHISLPHKDSNLSDIDNILNLREINLMSGLNTWNSSASRGLEVTRSYWLLMNKRCHCFHVFGNDCIFYQESVSHVVLLFC